MKDTRAEGELLGAVLRNVGSFTYASEYVKPLTTFLNANSVDAISLYTGCMQNEPALITAKGKSTFLTILKNFSERLSLTGFEGFLSKDFQRKKAAVDPESKLLIGLAKDGWEGYARKMLAFHRSIDVGPNANLCKQFKAMFDVFDIQNHGKFSYNTTLYGGVGSSCVWEAYFGKNQYTENGCSPLAQLAAPETNPVGYLCGAAITYYNYSFYWAQKYGQKIIDLLNTVQGNRLYVNCQIDQPEMVSLTTKKELREILQDYQNCVKTKLDGFHGFLSQKFQKEKQAAKGNPAVIDALENKGQWEVYSQKHLDFLETMNLDPLADVCKTFNQAVDVFAIKFEQGHYVLDEQIYPPDLLRTPLSCACWGWGCTQEASADYKMQ